MRLYIAEKPSLGRAIADVLPKPHQRGEGFIRVGNGDIVSWCIGHLLEQAEPEAYNEAYKQWRLEHLPILPVHWQLAPKASTRKQLTVLRKWVKEADELVHAGDPDREGQLLVDQVIDYLGVKGVKRDSIQRCLINDLNPSAVSRALQQLRSNRDFVALSTSALARSRADWLYGINLTRAYTLQGKKVGYDGLLSVGRVQTPILGLVVRRDRDIEQFVPRAYFEVVAQLNTIDGEAFSAKWQPSEACAAYLDEEGRVLNRALAENVISRITGQPGEVTQVHKQSKSQVAPLPYNLSALQIDAAKALGLSAKQVLDICQTLYERHKLITYPRSDSRYLPAEHFKQAEQVMAAISENCSALHVAVKGADSDLKSRAWNDSKVDAHHAIIPTMRKVDCGRLSLPENRVYELISRQYLCQFYPKWQYSDTRVEVCVGGGLFVAKARTSERDGWKVLFEKRSSHSGEKGFGNGGDQNKGRDTDKDSDSGRENAFRCTSLPRLKQGQALQCVSSELLDKHTQPPKYFTDATLLAAMTGIARYVNDAEIRKILKETDGLGTEATRAGILELLFKRQFLQRKGKQIISTPAAKGLIDSLPLSATTPDMTAQWEATLNAISQRKTSYAQFMAPLTEKLQALILQSQSVLPTALRGVKASTFSGSAKKRYRNKPVAKKAIKKTTKKATKTKEKVNRAR